MANSILFIEQYPDIGGGQTIYLQLIKLALEANNIVTAMFPRGGTLEKRIEEYQGNTIKKIYISHLKLNDSSKSFMDILKMVIFCIYFLKYIQTIQKNQIIYVNNPRMFIPILFISLFVKREFIYHIHLEHTTLEKYVIYFFLKINNTHKIVVNSQYIFDSLCRFNKIFQKTSNVLIIENSLSREYSELQFINRFQERPENFHAAIIGKIIPQKGQDVLLELSGIFNNVKFYLIGNGQTSYMDKLRHNLKDNVIFIGESDNINRTVNKIPIHISLIPSRVEESFGLVAIESMACSCITIVSKKGELPNIASKTGAICYDNTAELVNILKDLLQMDIVNLCNLSKTQHDATIKAYHFSLFEKRVKELFQQLLPSGR